MFTGPGKGHLSEAPDGRRILGAYRDGTLREWSLEDSEGEAVVLHHDAPVHTVWFSPDGRLVAMGTDDGVVRVWLADGVGGPNVLGAHEPFEGVLPSWVCCDPSLGVSSVRFSPDGRRLVTASRDRTAKIWPADGTGEPIVLDHGASVGDAAFSPDGRSVLTGANDGRVLMWSSDGTGEPVLLTEHREMVAGLSFSPDGKRVLSTGRSARITDLDGTEEPLTLHGEYWVSDAELSPDGEWVALESGDVRVFPVRTDAPPVFLRGGETEFSHVAFSPDGDRILAGAWDGTAWIWRLDGPDEPIELSGHTARVMGVAFSPDGTRVATALLDGTVRI